MGKRQGEGQRNREGMRGAGSRTERWSKEGKETGSRTKGRRDKDGGRDQDKGMEEEQNSDGLQD